MFQDGVGIGRSSNAERGDCLQIRKGFDHHQTATVAQDDMSTFSVERGDDVARFIIYRHDPVLTRLIN